MSRTAHPGGDEWAATLRLPQAQAAEEGKGTRDENSAGPTGPNWEKM